MKKKLPNSRVIDLTGQKFSMLTAKKLHSIGKSGTKWVFQCDCGKKVVKLASNVKKTEHKHSCGCIPTYAGLGNFLAGFNRLWANYNTSARNRGYNFNLTKKYFRALIESNCHYCNAAPSGRYEKFTAATIQANGIDRIDNRYGYTKNNVVTCCSTCNRAKYAMSKTEFLTWVKRVYNFNKGNF